MTATGTRLEETSAVGSRRKRSGRAVAVTRRTTPSRADVPRVLGPLVRELDRRIPGSRSGRTDLPSTQGVQILAHSGVAAEARRPAIGKDARTWKDGPPGVARVGKVIGNQTVEKATRRGNYESGSDYVLEYGELRFSFNEHDFAQRVEQAAVKLDFVEVGLESEEFHDLLELAVNGEIREPTSPLGEHINEHWTEPVGPANRSLVHWIRRSSVAPGSTSGSRRASSTSSSRSGHAHVRLRSRPRRG